MLENEAGLAEATARAMRELAGTVIEAPPLRLAARPGAAVGRLARPRRWTLWAVPLGAAAAVLALAVALVVIKDLPNGRAPSPAAAAYPAAAGLPAYYVAPQIICRKGKCDPVSLVVGNTRTGARLATLSPPRGSTFEAVSAAADSRTFVADAVGYPVNVQAPQRATWYLITIAPGSRSPARLARLPIAAGPAGGYVQSIAESAAGRELAVAYRLGRGRQGPTVLRTYSIATGHLLRSWSTRADVQLSPLPYPAYIQVNNELGWVDGDRALTFTAFPPLSGTSGKTEPRSIDVRVLDVTAQGDDLIAGSRVVWSTPDRPGETPAPTSCGPDSDPALAADGTTVLCTSLTSTPLGTGRQARSRWQMTWLRFRAAAPRVISTAYTATATESANQAGINGAMLWADPSGSTMIIVWSEGTTNTGAVTEKIPHFGILRHGRLSQLPLPAISPLASPTLLDLSPNIAW